MIEGASRQDHIVPFDSLSQSVPSIQRAEARRFVFLHWASLDTGRRSTHGRASAGGFARIGRRWRIENPPMD
jgi:hypothetical protein